MELNPTATFSGLGLLTLLTALGWSFFFYERRRRRHVELSLERQRSATLGKIPSHQALEREVLAFRSREQRRISNQLHDGVGQNLAGIAMLLSGLEQRLRHDGSLHVGDVVRITDLIEKTQAKAEELLLDASDSERPVLMEGLRELCHQTETLFEVSCVLSGQEIPEISPRATRHLLAIAEEAVTNAVKHAHPKQIGVSLRQEEGSLVLSVEDDGSGLDASSEDRKARGQRVMTLRAEKLGGTLQVRDRSPHGVYLECRIPAEGLAHGR